MARRAVLGIDAAWSLGQPSGVALLSEGKKNWEAVAAAPSYETFLQVASGGQVDWTGSHRGHQPDPAALVGACKALLGASAELVVVAVDMPLSHSTIVGRRRADDSISRTFGGRWCSTHSPSLRRPGLIGESLRKGFEQEGFPLAVKEVLFPALIEVYPHPALLQLLRLEERFKYKVAKRGRLWKDESSEQRLVNVLSAQRKITQALCERGVSVGAGLLPLPKSGAVVSPSRLKAFEDTVDALVSAWVAVEYLSGRCRSYGDSDAAIWVPS